MVKATSVHAYNLLRANGTLTERQTEVYNWLHKYGPCTARELHEHVVKDENVVEAALEGPNYVKPRLTELKEQDLVAERGKRKCSVTDITVTVLDTK